MGRKLDEGKQREIVAILSVGCSRRTAALYVGCCVDTIRNTAERDADFAARLQQAETSHEILHMKNINSAAADSRYWRAAAWALERIYPDRYGQRKAHTVSADQVTQLLAELAGVILQEVKPVATRKKILVRLQNLTQALKDSVPQPQAAHGAQT
jgi:hypothetical protein